MNILITGGAGFIGSNLIRLLIQGDEGRMTTDGKIVNLDKLTYAGNPENLVDLEQDSRYVFAQGDIADSALVEALLREHAIDAVINFAAESHVDRSIDTPEPFFQTNVIGTLRLLDACRRHHKTLSATDQEKFRFLHISTDEVYGTLSEDDPVFSEETAYAPNSPYSASKAASDHIIRAAWHTYQFPVLTTNCSNNYGPYQFPEKLIPLMVLNALEGKPLPIYGDGMNVRDWLYVEDHCRGIWQVLNRGRLGETYNIGGLNEKPNIYIVDTLCALLDELAPGKNGGKPYASLKTFVKDRPGHDRRYAIDCDKIQKELGWQPLESFESGIRKTVEWYLTHREWCHHITQNKYQRQRLGQ